MLAGEHTGDSEVDIVVIGAGPTGLGAAWRLQERNAGSDAGPTWMVVDRADVVGGMARSIEHEGFIWDLGGHVLYPHYEYFDALLDRLVDDWHYVRPVRGAWMWDRFIPYPVQRNIGRFPQSEIDRVIDGFRSRPATAGSDFGSLLRSQFGDGLVEAVLGPLNRKMWATEPTAMGTEWTGHRSGSSETNVPLIDVDEVLADIEAGRDRPAWDDQTRIRYPGKGGTGAIWEAVLAALPTDRVHLGTGIERLSTADRTLTLTNGRRIRYGQVITSMPLDLLLKALADRPDLTQRASELRPVRTTVVGVGLRGYPPDALAEMCSLYIPEPRYSMWRLTVLSNYSPHCVPTDTPHWSLLAEVNTSDAGATDLDALVETVVDDLTSLGFVDPSAIATTWRRHLGHGYPVPLLGRDALLRDLHKQLEAMGIYSRGRFGGWKYEVSNQDHAFMQGVEVVDRILSGRPETTFVLDPA
jgi:protoporphyrinogen oxidase